MKKLAIIAVFLMVFAIGCKTVDVDNNANAANGVEMVITPEDTGQAQDTGEIVSGTETGATGGSEAPEQTAEAAAEEKPAQTSDITLSEDKCDESAVLGFKGCLFKGDDLEITVKNVGRGDLGGVYYRFYDASYNKLGAKPEMFDFRIGEEKTLLVPKSEFPYTWKVDIHPVQGNDICSNQQLVVIPETNCK